MKYAIKSITLILLFYTLVFYNELKDPIPRDMVEYNSSYILGGQSTFRFKVNVEGAYEISIHVIDSTFKKLERLSYQLEPNHVNSSNQEPVLLKNGEAQLLTFQGQEKTTYELKIRLIHAQGKRIPVKMDVSDFGATASKNFYFMKEFRPSIKKIYSVLLILLLIFSSVSFYFVSMDWITVFRKKIP